MPNQVIGWFFTAAAMEDKDRKTLVGLVVIMALLLAPAIYLLRTKVLSGRSSGKDPALEQALTLFCNTIVARDATALIPLYDTTALQHLQGMTATAYADWYNVWVAQVADAGSCAFDPPPQQFCATGKVNQMLPPQAQVNTPPPCATVGFKLTKLQPQPDDQPRTIYVDFLKLNEKWVAIPLLLSDLQ